MKPSAHRLLPLTLALLAASATPRAGELTIYRCTDGQGHLTLRDTPCKAGEKQESRDMLRPQDPPPRPVPVVSAPAPAERPPAPSTRYVVVSPAQPLYECVAPDGERYTSDTAQGRPRWEPTWTVGYPAYPVQVGGGGSYRARVDYRGDKVSGSVRIGGGTRPMPPTVLVPAYPAGQWVYDECHRLAQAEVCDRLRDERFELNRRWNIAQPSERAVLDRDIRGIDARLGSDCGGA